MFFLSRSLFASILTVLIGIFIFFNYHGTVSAVSGGIVDHLRMVDRRVSKTAVANDYEVVIKKRKTAAKIPSLPDVSSYTVDNIAAKAPDYTPGEVLIADMVGLPAAREFIKKDGRVQRLRLSQMAVTPQVIYVKQGHYDFTHLYKQIKVIDAKAIEKRDNQYLLRLPILVAEGASLTISDKDTSEVLLSQDQTVFIANAGDLYILRTKITGWSEKENKPSLFKDKTIYRPYLVSWSGGRMYLAGSTFSSLGYRKGKSYGITYSSCQPCLQMNPELERPTGAIVGNTFTDLYFGFYSYEAENIAIVGNVYANNAIYGIDPHDRSTGLIIAHNETYGSGKKHGIIISRDVNDSWIFSNHSHHNHGSGIMIDRNSQNNVIADNIASYNGGDGLTFFESQNNTVYGNRIYQNKMSGVRIRNSWNIRMIGDQIADNGSIPIVLYSADLSQTQRDRDLEQDPYSQRAGAEISDAVIKLTDTKPAIKLNGIESLSLSNINLMSGGNVFSDHLFLDEKDISRNMDSPHKQVLVAKKEALTKLSQK